MFKRLFHLSHQGEETDQFHLVPEEQEQKFRQFTTSPSRDFVSNKVSHQKYTWFNLIPKFLFLQFRYFFNFFYLAITVSQLVPAFRIGFLVTYIGPLLFVLAISFIKEMCDEFQKASRDRELNQTKYVQITPDGRHNIASQDLKVGTIIEVSAGQRIPADLILLRTSDDIGTAFIKTDQLDGETDWKLRRALACTQSAENIFDLNLSFDIEDPTPEIYEFTGRYLLDGNVTSIGIDNTVWCETAVASGTIIGIVAYTGVDTRSARNASKSPEKIGAFDRECNKYCSILFILLFGFAFVSAAMTAFTSNFLILFIRFVLLYSYIIPISMKVNLDMVKLFFSLKIKQDNKINGAIMRNSSLPEELGRVQFLLTDKTGTLTQNEMEFKKLQYDNIVIGANSQQDPPHPMSYLNLALCHSVTVADNDYQASSPDEIALVRQAARFGYMLIDRSDVSITINDQSFDIIATLPFSSVWSHMGIVLRHPDYGTFLLCKGSDASISQMIPPSEWLDEIVGNLAREGLRTLVFCYRKLNDDEVDQFVATFREASTALGNRGARILEAFKTIEHDMELTGVSGVEDKLQEDVPATLEALEAANIKIWMLTGDKLETAICIALSSRLFPRDVEFRIIRSFAELVHCLDTITKVIPPLVIDGSALQMAIDSFPEFFLSVALKAPAIVVCRCSPSQKKAVVQCVQKYSNVVTCAVGDGGNDVSMIQAANIGVGIVGKEGKQASLAADVSINQFSHLQRLLFWHGTNSYKHSSRLAQFVMHRGIIMTTTQALYSFLFNFVPSAVYNDWLLMGFATIFTSFPVFSLILDEFMDEATIMAYPELYTRCQKGLYFSPKTFLTWTWLAIFQGSVVVFMAANVFSVYDRDARHFQSIAYTSLLLTELALVYVELNKPNRISAASEFVSVMFYLLSFILLPDAFDVNFILSWEFLWKITIEIMVCVVPLLASSALKKKFNPTHEDQLKDPSHTTESTSFLIL